MPETIAIAINIEAPQTELVLLNKTAATQNKLVASWQLDEHSKLYCQWILQITNINK